MTVARETVVNQVRGLLEKAERAGLVDPDPQASLEEAWRGPDVDVDEIAALGDEAVAAVRQACLEGRAHEAPVAEALDLVRVLLPLALRNTL